LEEGEAAHGVGLSFGVRQVPISNALCQSPWMKALEIRERTM
jgi:hypothetical protein